MLLDFSTIPATLRLELKNYKDFNIHFAALQPILDGVKILPSGAHFCSKVHNSHHVARVAYLVEVLESGSKLTPAEEGSLVTPRKLQLVSEMPLFFKSLKKTHQSSMTPASLRI